MSYEKLFKDILSSLQLLLLLEIGKSKSIYKLGRMINTNSNEPVNRLSKEMCMFNLSI